MRGIDKFFSLAILVSAVVVPIVYGIVEFYDPMSDAQGDSFYSAQSDGQQPVFRYETKALCKEGSCEDHYIVQCGEIKYTLPTNPANYWVEALRTK